MVDDELLNQINIPTPCPMDWDGMSGNDRMRFCDFCGKHVYNFAAMTSNPGLFTCSYRSEVSRATGRQRQMPLLAMLSQTVITCH